MDDVFFFDVSSFQENGCLVDVIFYEPCIRYYEQKISVTFYEIEPEGSNCGWICTLLPYAFVNAFVLFFNLADYMNSAVIFVIWGSIYFFSENAHVLTYTIYHEQAEHLIVQSSQTIVAGLMVVWQPYMLYHIDSLWYGPWGEEDIFELTRTFFYSFWLNPFSRDSVYQEIAQEYLKDNIKPFPFEYEYVFFSVQSSYPYNLKFMTWVITPEEPTFILEPGITYTNYPFYAAKGPYYHPYFPIIQVATYGVAFFVGVNLLHDFMVCFN